MKILITTAVIFGIAAISETFSQAENESNHAPTLGKRIERGNISAEPKTKMPDSPESNMENMAKPEDRIKSNSVGVVSKPKPATKTTSKLEIKKIKYSLNNNNSDLQNLLTLIEIKERVNEPQNIHLTSTPEYKVLLSDISNLRNQFDNYVASKGIENCSTTEQNHYLAFLKEEGKDEEYSKAMNRLK